MVLKNKYLFVLIALFILMWYNVSSTSEVGTLRLKSGVVKIYTKGKITGSGFIIKHNKDLIYILTAYHVVENDDAPFVEFFTYDGGRTHQKIAAQRICFDRDSDIALLKVSNQDNMPPPEKLYVYKFYSCRLKEQNQIQIIGVPADIDSWTISDGQIIQVGSDVIFTGFFQQGNSGGPLVKDDDVVGIVKDSASASCGHAIPVSLLQLFLDDHDIKL